MEHLVYHAKKIGKKYIYLGTCYGEKALYKVRDFKGIEFYDGNKWIKDNKILKDLCKSDQIKQIKQQTFEVIFKIQKKILS